MQRRVSTLGLIVVTFGLVAGQGIAVRAAVIERIHDGCSGDVVVKVPYPNPDPGSSSPDGNDIVLARSKTFCQFVEGSTSQPPIYKGVCQHDPTKKSALTAPILYSSIRNSDRRFRWFCGKTPERSRCIAGTRRVRFLIGPDDLFETLCLND